MFLEYILQCHLQDCLNILCENDSLGYYSVKIDFMNLFEKYPDIGDKVLCSPIETLPQCERDVIKAQQTILENDEYKTQIAKLPYHTLKRNVHARFFGLPFCPELHRTIFPKNVDMGCFLKVTGTVVRVTQTKMLEYHRNYVCAKCKHENFVEAQFENRYVLRAPQKCGNEDKRCKSTTFTQVNLVSREHCKDYQEIKIQEQVNKLSIGTIPGSMWVVLEDDLVDICKPGDDVHICGTVRRRWRPSVSNKKCEVDLVLQANYLEVCNAQRSEVVATAPDVKDCFDDFWDKYSTCPMKGRDRVLSAVCPQVYGLHLVKLALLLTVITGSNHIADTETDKCNEEDRHSTRVRGQCHLLLVGDPGTGKSQLLKAGAELTARSVFTSGAGSTRAGLTCSALREDGEWQLEAGALVLSDGGVCCIDEVGQLRDHDRTSIHEAMEQQTISIAKAGIVCKLNTRCAVVAACNPKGHYDTDQPLSANVSLGTPLLSRFDLIFILLDSKNKVWDKLVSSYILFGDSDTQVFKNQWELEKLQTYIALVGPRSTKMTRSANVILQTYYMVQRKSQNRDPSRTTVRMLDSLVRLSQAHCRLMYRTTIIAMDAIVAVSLVDLSMQDCTLKDTVDALHSTFPKHPDYNYLCTAKKLLARLDLQEIWEEELLYYSKLLEVDRKTLQSEIEHQSSQMFAKFDDLSDDNVTLSSTVITSSYFKKEGENLKCDNEMNTKDNKSINKNGVSNKLAETLKKHASKNKDDNILVIPKAKGSKRKRTEVVVDINELNTKNKTKKNKKGLRNNDVVNMLNAVPSAFDVFSDLGMDYNSDHDSSQHSENAETSKEDNTRSPDKDSNLNKIEETDEKTTKESPETTNKNIPNINTSNNSTKLEMFKFAGKRDMSKYIECANKSVTDIKQTNLKSKTENNSMTQKSLFETSICDIDLDMELEKPGTEMENNVRVKQERPSQSSQQSLFETNHCDLSITENTKEMPRQIEEKSVAAPINTKSKSSLTPSSSQLSLFETSNCDIDLEL